MAHLIEFFIPDRFRRKVKWVPPNQRGKIIERGFSMVASREVTFSRLGLLYNPVLINGTAGLLCIRHGQVLRNRFRRRIG